MQVTSAGSVRVDLVGGTLDLEPINLILPNVVTLNVATSLQAKVEISELETEELIIESLDYKKTYRYSAEELTAENIYQNNYFQEMTFVIQILDLFDEKLGLHIKLSSGAPAGSGLGGSSAMGVTLYKAMSALNNIESSVAQTVLKVKGVEGRILNQGIPGYQDYYPALTGGVLSLKGVPGEIQYEQLYSDELKDFLENHITLVYSGISRASGINNWHVYKGFFDRDKTVRAAMEEIAKVSFETYLAIKEKKFEKLLTLIGQEGESRKMLSPNIVPAEIDSFYYDLKNAQIVTGLKMCGAGGGGCFILTHTKAMKQKVHTIVGESSFKLLDFNILPPLQ